MANFFNPLADNFSVARLLLALLAGVGVPLLAQLAVQHAATLRALGDWLGGEPKAALTLVAVAFTGAGAALGWLFGNKSFIWALLLSYLASRLAGGEHAFYLALWMGLVADRLGAFRAKRAALV